MSAVAEELIVSPRDLTDEQIRLYNEQGYVLLPGLVSSPDAARLKADVMAIMETIGLGTTKLKQSHEFLEGSPLDTFVNSADLRRVAEQLMGGASTLYLPFTAVKSGGGGGEFHFHQDNQYTRFDGPGINLWFALGPMTEENGCLRVVPQSHLHGTLPSEQSPDKDGHRKVVFEPEDFVSVLMQPGDCVAFSRLTVHGSGPNTTDEPRAAYAVQFHRDDVRAVFDSKGRYEFAPDEWKLLKENPRWTIGPVKKITIPKGKVDGH